MSRWVEVWGPEVALPIWVLVISPDERRYGSKIDSSSVQTPEDSQTCRLH